MQNRTSRTMIAQARLTWIASMKLLKKLSTLVAISSALIALPCAQAMPWPAQPIEAQALAEKFTSPRHWQDFDWSVARETSLWRDPRLNPVVSSTGPWPRHVYADLGDTRFSTRFAVSFLHEERPSARLLALTLTEESACDRQAGILSTAYGLQPVLDQSQSTTIRRTWQLGQTQVALNCYPSGRFTGLEVRFEAAGKAVAIR